MKKKLITIGMVAAITVLIIFKLFSNKAYLVEKEATAMEQQLYDVIPVKTYTLKTEDYTSQLIQSGTFTPQQELKLMAQSQGQIKHMYVKKAQFVSKGTLLAKIDNTALTSQMSTAKASLEQAQQDAQRMRNALVSGGVTKQQVENAELQVKNMQSTVSQLQQQSANYSIIAPVSGVVNEIFAEAGSFVTVGAAVLQIVDITKVILNVSVNQELIPTLKMGQKVKVTTDVYPEIEMNGKIEAVNVKADASQKIEVGVSVINTREHPILAGMFGRAEFINDGRSNTVSLLTIPRSAIIGSIQDAKVYVVKADSTVMLRSIKVGKTIDNNLEVVKGLTIGEHVVTAGQINLEEGLRVTVKN